MADQKPDLPSLTGPVDQSLDGPCSKEALIAALLCDLNQSDGAEPYSTDKLHICLTGIGQVSGVLSETKLLGIYRMAVRVDVNEVGRPTGKQRLVEFFFSASDVQWVSRYRDDITQQAGATIIAPGQWRG